MLIEQTVLEYLQEALDMTDIYLEIPREIPDAFVVFRITDRDLRDQINGVTVEFSSYADTKYNAAVLDNQVREAMLDINSIPSISCRFGGGNDNPDTTLKLPRYRCYFNLYY